MGLLPSHSVGKTSSNINGVWSSIYIMWLRFSGIILLVFVSTFRGNNGLLTALCVVESNSLVCIFIGIYFWDPGTNIG